MSPEAHNDLKSSVSWHLRHWDSALFLPGDSFWELPLATDPATFFRHLPLIFPHGGTLFFEGVDLGLSAKTLYAEHPPRYTAKILTDGLSPAPESFHVGFTPELADRLCALITSQGQGAVFRHFKGYEPSALVFTLHTDSDAMDGTLCVSSAVEVKIVETLATALGTTAKLTAVKDHRATLAALDKALNPPWWKKLFGIGPKITGE